MDKFEPIVKTYYDALEDGKILARRCNCCGAYMYPPMPICQVCSSTDTEWVQITGEGRMLTVGSLGDSHIWPAFQKYLPVRWGEIELAEGPCITGMVTGIKDEEAIAAMLPLPVKAEIIQDDGFKRVVFHLIQ